MFWCSLGGFVFGSFWFVFFFSLRSKNVLDFVLGLFVFGFFSKIFFHHLKSFFKKLLTSPGNEPEYVNLKLFKLLLNLFILMVLFFSSLMLLLIGLLFNWTLK